eukprot:3832986-Prymnesium_polylepis.1
MLRCVRGYSEGACRLRFYQLQVQHTRAHAPRHTDTEDRRSLCKRTCVASTHSLITLLHLDPGHTLQCGARPGRVAVSV